MVNISEQVRIRTFERIPTPKVEGAGPFCVKCESRISGDECYVSTKRDGFYLHIECGENIGIKVNLSPSERVQLVLMDFETYLKEHGWGNWSPKEWAQKILSA